MTLTQSVHRYSGYVLLGASGILVTSNLFSGNLVSEALGALFLLSAAANYFTAPKTTTTS